MVSFKEPIYQHSLLILLQKKLVLAWKRTILYISIWRHIYTEQGFPPGRSIEDPSLSKNSFTI